jgi:class 3 adenylate cyclase/tetratricopeptide (TPR) repeat protein
MRCSKCGEENPEGNRFCGDCGAALANLCARCGADNPAGKRFCGDCGAALGASEGPAQPPSRPQPTAKIPTPAHPGRAAAPADGERRHLTVLFSDLVGSTEIAAHLDAEDWREIAAQYQRATAAAVTGFGGHVAKYLGDGLMVYFGWPQAHEDDPERAVRAGLAVVEEIAALNGRLAAAHKVKLAVRVGIQTGSVVMGQGGGEGADVFGDAPNVASRVQSAAEPDSVVITAAVHELVAGLFVVEDRGDRQLKGIAHPLKLYRVIEPAAMRRRAHRAVARSLTPFVGREDDLDLLLSRWERAREGQGQLVLVMGEPGIGKSRLVEEFRAQLRDQPHLWIDGAGQQFSQSTPFHAVTEMLEQGLGWRGDESPEERVTHLERRLEGAAELKLNEALPLIAELLNLPIPDRYPPLMFAPDQRRRRLLANLSAWALNLARVQPVVMAMEDLQWVDPSTLELAQTLVELAATAPLMLLCTTRPEFRAPWAMRAHHAQITLNRLNNRHTREMIAGVVARSALASELIDAVVQRTDGVPLFAEELTRLILEGDGRSVVHDIPATLHDSLAARLDRLGPAKEVAQVAAVIGREFSYELLRAVSAVRETELQSALQKLLDAEVIYARGIAPEATYQFKHALIQDAAYEALLKSRRRELHRLVAHKILEKFASLAEAQPELIARHWANANETEHAIAAWRKAGDCAFLRYACKETEASYRHALDLLRTLPESPERVERELELLNRFVPVLQLTRGWAAPEAAEAVAYARALAQKTDNPGQLLLQLVGSFVDALSRGDLSAAGALAPQVFDLAERDGSPPVLGLGRVIKLSASYFRGDLRDAEEHYAAGEGFFASAGEKFPSTVGSGFGFGSHVAWLLGRPDTARERIHTAIVRATQLGSPFELAYTQHVAAILQLFLKEFAEAKSAAAESIALADEHGFRQYAAGSRVFFGLAEAALGHLGDGMPNVYLGLEGLNESGAGIMMPLYLCWVAIAESLEGRVPQALERIENALLASPLELTWGPEVTRMRGELRRVVGQTEQAEADFRGAIALAQEISAKAWELRAATSLARLLGDAGRRDEGRAVLSGIYDWFTEGSDTADLKEAKALLGELSNP